MDNFPFPITVEGEWSPAQCKGIKNKLQLHFQSRKKSSGGECRVEVADDGRATVCFRSDEVRDRVLAQQNHEISLESQNVKLRLSCQSIPVKEEAPPDLPKKSPDSNVGPENGGSGAGKEDAESAQSVAALLENVKDGVSKELLSMLVENVSGLDEDAYGLEVIWETNNAVVTFSDPSDVERFLTASKNNVKLQKFEITARPLEEAKSVRVENLAPAVIREMLELYFEKSWTLPVKINMIPEEQAAIVTFDDPKVVGSITKKRDHVIRKFPVRMYLYYESLGSALYGKERPTWKMPEPFTESVHQVVWKFILMKKQFKTISDHMRPYFCSVDMEKPEVKLSPLPDLLRQKGLTAKHVDTWMDNAQKAFRQFLNQYSAFECLANASAWKLAEKDIRSVVREDAVLVMDASRGALTVAGRDSDMKRIRASVERIVLKAMSQIERQMNGISEMMDLTPAMYYILNQEGLQKAAQDISPELLLSYQEDTKTLTISGLAAEVYMTKSWILEKTMKMSKKPLHMDTCLLDFLKSVDPTEMSQDLFISQGIGAVYSIENRGVFLTGISDSVLNDAEEKVKMALSMHILDVKDQKVLQLPKLIDLNQQLSETYNSSKKKTMTIQIQPGGRNQITVAGFLNPVKEVSSTLKKFIVDYSHVQETIRVLSCAVVQFIQERKSETWKSIAKDDKVTVHFDPKRPRIKISGARLHVQKANTSFKELAAALFTDNFTVDKPGAKKYFLSQGGMFLSTVMKDLGCVVVLRPDNEDEEEEDLYEDIDEEYGLGTTSYCRVPTASGLVVSVSKGDICSLHVDAVVNAANEELKHIGGVAFALLKAAGPQLQKLSDDYISKKGHLKPGDAIITDSCNLPCKYVVHAVGPRFSDFDKKNAVLRLKQAVKESLRQAAAASCSSVALPAISSGVFGFPLDLCTETIAEAVREYCDSPRGPGSLTEIHLMDNNDNTVRSLANAINKEFSDLKPEMTIPQQVESGRGSGSSSANWERGQGAQGYQSGAPRGGGRGRGRGRGGGYQGPPRSDRAEAPPMKTGYERVDHDRITTTTPEGLKIILKKGNIQDQFTDVIVNTIAENLNLNQGAVSKAILAAAGPGLQSAVRQEARAAMLQYGDVVVTDGFNLKSQKVFHAVCPFWDNGTGQAKEELITVIRFCLTEAEKHRMASVSFPAIGTGNLSFPRELVSRVLLGEIQAFSSRRNPQHLREVAVVVHPSDSQTVDCFTREFRGQAHGHVQHEASSFDQSPRRHPRPQQQQQQPQQSSASFGPVSSLSLGVYQMKMGQLTLEVSSGDITKETSDAIVNSSNQDFSLRIGVSKAILDAAGSNVQQEVSRIVNAPGYQQRAMILTTAGLLPSGAIIHVVGHKDPVKIKEVVYSVLKLSEQNTFSSVSFPALGTGQGGASPSAVADAMIDAVVDFVRKKPQSCVRTVKILIFQTNMMKEFHRSMRRREGEEVEEKSIFTKVKDAFTSLFEGASEERPTRSHLYLEREEFEPAVFQLCAESKQVVSQAKQRIKDLIVSEQAEKTITDPFINELSQSDMEELKALQRKLTVSIRLEKRRGDQEPFIQLEGLTRDVFIAESAIRDIIRKVERTENMKRRAFLLSALVQWQYQDQQGVLQPFDIYTNCTLEEALEKKSPVKIKINNKEFTADLKRKKAVSAGGRTQVELIRKDLKDDVALPAQWEDMKGVPLKRCTLTPTSQEYKDVEQELKRTGLTPNIISIERIQNKTLWQSYQLFKKNMEEKNKHKNNEKQLFHGTGSNSIDLINNQGFNRSYAGTHAAMYGNGSYFALTASYSHGYAQLDAQGHRRMYLARVLVGEFTQGKRGLITPPAKGSGNAADLYDSVTDNAANPSMFIVFNDIQAYPEYLITYT
ncbi:protein mono-ADP-ribosyltransferase PARP14-like isoform X2 [Myripristis murdjan]|uniref:protein mono-ADP-ribosyltransferase PARP14-like isoform X2 n=1 Tax=Myripristis murdjan TaxID=586833 RepID=UPI0011762174|nr:protein mono-ADP-ribosyltransferase PARP14-like isoform X2 [Myripristis murdjan]